MHTVEVIRGPGVNAKPMIAVQRRPDEETFAMTVAEAERYLETEAYATPCTAKKCGGCLWCDIADAVEGLA